MENRGPKTIQKRKKVSCKTLTLMWKNRYYYLLLLPAILFFVLFKYVPMAGIVLAFKDYSFQGGIWGSKWVGFEHFERLFSSASFYEILRNTLLISIYKLIFCFPVAIIFALLLNEIKNIRFKKMIQTISYLPYFISWVVLGTIIMELLSPSQGVVNYLLGLVGIEPIHFLADTKYFRGVLVATDIWKNVGWDSIIYLSAIAGVDIAQYESASIDGANRWDKAIRITLPSIMPTIVTMFILRMGSIMDGSFDQIFNLYNEIVYSVADTIDTYVYRVGLTDMQYDYTTAVGLFKNVIGFTLVILSNYIVRHIGEGENKLW